MAKKRKSNTNLSGLQQLYSNKSNDIDSSKHRLSYLYLLIVMLLHTYALVEIINSSLLFGYSVITFYIGVIVITLLHLFLLKQELRLRNYNVLILASLLLYLLIFRRAVVYAGMIFINRLREIMNIIYFSNYKALGGYIYSKEAMTYFYLLIVMISLYLIVLSVEHLKKHRYLYIFDAFFLIVFLFLHRNPNDFAIVIIIGCLFSLFIYQQNRYQKSIQKSMQLLLVIALLFGCVVNYSNQWLDAEALMKKRKEINDYLLNFRIFNVSSWDFTSKETSENAKISHGMLRLAVSFNYSGEAVLYMTSSERVEDPIYLKGFVSSIYQNGMWIDQSYYVSENNSELFDLFYYQNPNIIMIEYLLKNNQYLIPYAAIDYYHTSDLSNTALYYAYSMDFTALSEEELLEYFFETLQLNYQRTIERTGQNQFVNMNNFVTAFYNQDVKDIQSIIAYIHDILNSYTYSRFPGETPAYQDYVEYFLLENKEGFCMHFATSAALLLQLHGVDSRYVEGYVAYPSDFIYNQELGLYEGYIRDYRAHAWVEIYVEEVGWIPIEVTPASATEVESTIENNLGNQLDETLHNGFENTITDNSSDTNEVVQEEPNATKTEVATSSIYKVCFYVLIGLLGITIILLLQARIRREFIKRKLVSNNQDNVRYCYVRLLKLLAILQFEYPLVAIEHESLVAFYRNYGFEQEVTNFVTIVYKTRFSNKDISQQEYQQVIDFYSTFAQYAYKNVSFIKKIILRWMYCLY